MEIFDRDTKECSEEFKVWRDLHPNGFVLNRRAFSEGMLHRANCMHFLFRRDDPVILTRNRKYCSSDRSELELWAGQQRIAITRCGTCDV
jgi:hypothetical protein